MAKYTKEEKQKAIDLYIRYCRQATKVIKELGYPNKRHTLVSWYRGYEEKGEVKDDGREEKKLSHVYSEDQVHTAVSFYIEHGKSLSKTVEYLGYPHRTRTLKMWVEKLSSEILFLYFHEKNLLIGFLVQLEGHRSLFSAPFRLLLVSSQKESSARNSEDQVLNSTVLSPST